LIYAQLVEGLGTSSGTRPAKVFNCAWKFDSGRRV
jgi:hypothetical protein